MVPPSICTVPLGKRDQRTIIRMLIKCLLVGRIPQVIAHLIPKVERLILSWIIDPDVVVQSAQRTWNHGLHSHRVLQGDLQDPIAPLHDTKYSINCIAQLGMA